MKQLHFGLFINQLGVMAVTPIFFEQILRELKAVLQESTEVGNIHIRIEVVSNSASE